MVVLFAGMCWVQLGKLSKDGAPVKKTTKTKITRQNNRNGQHAGVRDIQRSFHL